MTDFRLKQFETFGAIAETSRKQVHSIMVLNMTASPMMKVAADFILTGVVRMANGPIYQDLCRGVSRQGYSGLLFIVLVGLLTSVGAHAVDNSQYTIEESFRVRNQNHDKSVSERESYGEGLSTRTLDMTKEGLQKHVLENSRILESGAVQHGQFKADNNSTRSELIHENSRVEYGAPGYGYGYEQRQSKDDFGGGMGRGGRGR